MATGLTQSQFPVNPFTSVTTVSQPTAHPSTSSTTYYVNANNCASLQGNYGFMYQQTDYNNVYPSHHQNAPRHDYYGQSSSIPHISESMTHMSHESPSSLQPCHEKQMQSCSSPSSVVTRQNQSSEPSSELKRRRVNETVALPDDICVTPSSDINVVDTPQQLSSEIPNQTEAPQEVHVTHSSKKKGSPDGPKKRIKVKQSASEALCLARYLGLIIGHKVPRSNEHWQLYLIVRRLIDILTAPKYTRSDLWNLRNLIHAHNSMYFKLYGHLKPKMHFLLHYIELLLLNGPLINSWSMLFERKNKELRSIAVNTSSSVNLPLTLAFRNQIDFCSIQDRIVKLMPILEVGPVDSHFDNELSQFQNLRHIVNSTHCTHRSVKLYSKEYQPGSIVLIRVTDDEGPVFGRIHKIYSANNKVYFLFKKITTYYFYTHYHAYVVQTSDILSDFINVDLLPKPLVQCCLISKDGHEYIATRHQI
ncbi:hypothetical protein QAD02_003876 [Eretmocerus hayati]|uniref:Uncharacterized protein n=1 Tax=Eretmocerus hayati TaxID=131215 RepID=A0ACC2NNC8_9HYME|nr:hypothetical protein QAD02_003876 [Eretmocerus hayati]